MAGTQSFQDLRAGLIERSRFAVKTFQIAHFRRMGSASQVPPRSCQNKDKSTMGRRRPPRVDAGGDPSLRVVALTPCPKEGSHALRRAPNERPLSKTGGEARKGGPRGGGAGGGGPPPPAAPNPARRSGGEKAFGVPGVDRFGIPFGPDGLAAQESCLNSDSETGDGGSDLNRETRRLIEREDRRINPRTGRRYTTQDLPARAGKACHHCHELGGRDWWIWTWKSGNGLVKSRRPYRCGSYRCPVCRVQESHVQYARISESSAPLSPLGWCFLVLTLDRHGTYSGKPWTSQDEAFKGLQKLNQEFMRSLRRWFKKMGWEPLKASWVSTTEAHRSGWPHQNFLIWHPQLADWLAEQQAGREREGLSGRDALLVCRELADVVSRAGFGCQSTAERARSAEALASYIVKLSGEADKVVGEVTKLCQAPINAPVRFRRLRSGKGFLPPRKHAKDSVGKLCQRLATWQDFQERPLAGLHSVEDILGSYRVEWPDLPPVEVLAGLSSTRKVVQDEIASKADGLRARTIAGKLVAVSRGGKSISSVDVVLAQSETTGTLVRRTRYEGVPIVLGIHKPPAGEEDAASECRTIEQDSWESEEQERAELVRRGRTGQAERVGLPPVTSWVRGKRLERLARCEPREERKESAS